MTTSALILVVGNDALTERVCAELAAKAGQHVRVVWPVSTESDDALVAADVRRATSILTLSSDDELNLSVALRARMLNPKIRIVLRQFNPLLGSKIEQNLPDCTTLSPAAHSAATYAGAALDPGCFFALRFPPQDGPLLGFVQTSGAALDAVGKTVAETEQRHRVRILELGDRVHPPAGALIASNDAMITFGHVKRRVQLGHRESDKARKTLPGSSDSGIRVSFDGLVAWWHRVNPVLRLLLVSATLFFLLSFTFFHLVLNKSLAAASFYVVATMTNVGFGDVSVTRRGPLVTAGAIVAMLGGIVFTSIFVGYVSSSLTRAQWIALQGLRRIRARGHVVVCGAGKVGSAVVNLLTTAGVRVVVVDSNPDAGLVRRARERDVDLLTGDAHRDDALDLCDIPNASAVLALTDNDAVNLEIALGARARFPEVPLVVRMENDAFARAVSALFGIATFSPAALTAPVLAGLSRFSGTRGRVRYAREFHTIVQRSEGAVPAKPLGQASTPLCVWRSGHLHYLREFDEMQPYDELLFVESPSAENPAGR